MERPNTPEPAEHLQIVVQYPDGSTEIQRVIPQDAVSPGPLRPEADWNTEVGRAAKQTQFDQFISNNRMPVGKTTRLRWFTQVVRTVTDDPIRIREISDDEPPFTPLLDQTSTTTSPASVRRSMPRTEQY